MYLISVKRKLRFLISNIFYIKLKTSADYSLLQERANAKGAIIEKQIPFMPLWYQLKLNPNSIENTLTLTSEFWETGLFEDIDPGFLFNFNNDQNYQNNTSNSSIPTTCSNDTNFSSLWGLNNTTNPNIDINAKLTQARYGRNKYPATLSIFLNCE